MLENIRNIARYKLGGSTMLIHLYKLKKKNRDLIVNKNHHLCLEAYPRTANTFSVLLIQQCALNDISIAHHMHTSGQILLAKKYDIPTVILVRNPLDSILSNLIRDQGMEVKTAVNWYRDFYQKVLDTDLRKLIWKFETITANPEVCLKELSCFINYEFDFNIYDKDEIFNKIKMIAEGEGKSGKLENYVAMPDDSRKEQKNILKEVILKNYSSELKELNNLYSEVLSLPGTV